MIIVISHIILINWLILVETERVDAAGLSVPEADI